MRLTSSLLLAVLAPLALTLLAACGATSSPAPTGAMTAAELSEATVLVSGTFEGRNDHEVLGNVKVVESSGVRYLILGDDFNLDGAPDPKLGFGNGGSYDTATTFSPLNSHSGSQVYELPAGFDIASYGEAYVWCEKFSVDLGVASLKSE